MQSLALLTEEDKNTVSVIANSDYDDLIKLINKSPLKREIFSVKKKIDDKALNLMGVQILRYLITHRRILARRNYLGIQNDSVSKIESDGVLVLQDIFSQKDVKDGLLHSNKIYRQIIYGVIGYKNQLEFRRDNWACINGDIQSQSHCDTFSPRWKIWVYAMDVELEHGPFCALPKSHLPTHQKLSFIYHRSILPYSKNFDEQDEKQWCRGSYRDLYEELGSPTPIIGKKFTTIIADVRCMHKRYPGTVGLIRKTYVHRPNPNLNPFRSYKND